MNKRYKPEEIINWLAFIKIEVTNLFVQLPNNGKKKWQQN